jgi:hypothetical protein
MALWSLGLSCTAWKNLRLACAQQAACTMLGVTHVIVGRVAVSLEYALEVAKETPWTFPFSAHAEIENYDSARPTVLPKIVLMVLATHAFGLNTHRRFIVLSRRLEIAQPVERDCQTAMGSYH